ncbi:MAG: bifunctional (p)ppGpp synthetase/guanosine-3',5'-bis(diphosphate) 3'-pyrophosphohydrolase [Lachnospiraceae bacterium]|nr:bifunctional (p)ppGpp synthetase/guanosine-3',5'-bis(diphosphate) 3'-pyrophosphohydrolase [Lachnospiraceae bacterium]
METKIAGKEVNIQMKRTEKKELSTPADFTSPEVLYGKLIDTVRAYHPSTDLSMIEKAYHLADEAHKGQLRKSGEPYIIHPICVAIILAELELDKETIIAGILHDVVEDTAYTLEEITEMFGSEIALLVDGVTKLTQLNYSKDKVELQAENLRKMFLAMAKDIRVILIKLADRLHNLRTLQYQKPEKQIEKARETMDIYAPLAQRLGISKIKVELDDLSLRYLEPEVCEELEAKIELRKDERTKFINGIIEEVREQIKKVGIEAEISGRVKHFFSIYKKMVNQNKTLDQIYDLFAVRIIVNTVKDCYAALGVIHEMYKPIPGRFKDYIAMPKPNMYQSLHTTLIGPNGTPFEIQIRTFDMHRTAEYGIAAHWKYKENQSGIKSSDTEEEKLAWLRQILEWQQEMSDSKEFLSSIKDDLDLFSDRIYCFTPTGDVKNLPTGSCPVDFAYAIHSAVGNKMVGARVNGKLVPIEYQLQNGDRVEIITSQNTKGPSRDWLSIVKSTQAKNKINQWFKTELKDDNIIHGKELLLAYCKAKGIQFSDLSKPEFMDVCMRKYGFRDWDSVLAAIGHGALKEGQIVNRLQEEYNKKVKREVTDEKLLESVGNTKETKPVSGKAKAGITVQGLNDVAVHLSKCCSPVPGDEIIGFVTRGRGVSIHRTDCINIINASEDDRHRMITAEWSLPEGTKASESYFAEITIYANNRSGVLLDISKIFTENKIDIMSLNSRTSKQGTATITVGFQVKGKEQLQYLITKIGNVESVLDVARTTG